LVPVAMEPGPPAAPALPIGPLDDLFQTPAPLDAAANLRRTCVLGLVQALVPELRPASFAGSIFAAPGPRGFGINHLAAAGSGQDAPHPPARADQRAARAFARGDPPARVQDPDCRDGAAEHR